MIYVVDIINPRTSVEDKVIVELSADQVAGAKASPFPLQFVQSLARMQMPEGFIPIGNGVRLVTQH